MGNFSLYLKDTSYDKTNFIMLSHSVVFMACWYGTGQQTSINDSHWAPPRDHTT
jgi:hypothetical protein